MWPGVEKRHGDRHPAGQVHLEVQMGDWGAGRAAPGNELALPDVVADLDEDPVLVEV